MEKHIASARNPFRQFREIPQILLQNRESLRKFSIFPQQIRFRRMLPQYGVYLMSAM